ncbi:hypothetical protein DB41_IB00910 [Neochlamydia sp. TUME1]|nr:hypothetical protein DB41_IB00910 [Neochlamydia sp. TUME1]
MLLLVILIGATTHLDIRFSEFICLPLPSGSSAINIPIRVCRKWERADHKPYTPDHQFLGLVGAQ